MANDVAVQVEIGAAREKQGDELTKRASSTLKLADAFTITEPGDFELAAKELASVGKTIDAIDAFRKDITRPIDEAKKKIMDRFKPALALLEQAKGTLNRKMLAYRDEEDRKRREAQAKLDEAARKEREKLEAEARKLAAKGKSEQAAEKLAAAAGTVAPVVAPAAVPAVKGVASRRTWKAEVNDIVALCRAVADGHVAPIAVEANMVFLNEQARSLEDHFNIPGCRAYPQDTFGRTRS